MKLKQGFLLMLLLLALCLAPSALAGTLSLPRSLRVIGQEAFYGDKSLDKVTVPSGVEEIGARAFSNSSLKEITIPKSVKKIADDAFSGHVKELVLKGPAGSIVEEYAKKHGIKFDSDIVHLTEDWGDYAGMLSALVKDNKGKVSQFSGNGAYASGRIIAKVKGELPDISAYNPVAVIRDPEDHYLIQCSNDVDAKNCADLLSHFSNTVYVEPDRAVVAHNVVQHGSVTKSKSWGVAATHMDAYAADLKKRGKNSTIIVAVLDSGVDASHSFLKKRLVTGYDFLDDDSTPQPRNNHGTHVAGIIADCTAGLNVKIMPICVIDDTSGSEAIVAEAIGYAVRNHANVINLSLGSFHSERMEEAINNAIKKGVTVVASAGNDNENTALWCPAHMSSCITVVSVDSSKQRAYNSNFGNAVDISAPGMGILSSIPGGKFANMDGTSMAAPHVSAAAAMLLCDYPNISPAKVADMLKGAATDLGDQGRDPMYGQGLLNMKPFVKGDPRQFAVTYNANGGTGAPAKQTKVEGINLTLSAGNPTKSCVVTFNDGAGGTQTRTLPATFLRWNTQADGKGTSYSPGASYTANAEATLFAQWQNATLGSLPTPTRNGYRFVGWFTAASGGNVVTAATVVTGNMTVYAQWSDLSTYTIIYNANSGVGAPGNQSKYQGTALALSTAKPTKTYTVTLDDGQGQKNTVKVSAVFDSWNTSADGKGTRYAPGASYTANDSVMLYAQWRSGTLGTLPTPSRSGYRFTGWYTAASGGNGVNASTAVTGNMTLYAHWTPLTCTVTFQPNGADFAPESITVNTGSTIGELPAANRNYYTFLGWYTGTTGGSQFTNSTAVNGNMTVYARWQLNGFGDWSETTSPVTANDNREVKTEVRTVQTSTKTLYNYSRYVYWNNSAGQYWATYTEYGSGGQWQYAVSETPFTPDAMRDGHQRYSGERRDGTPYWYYETITSEPVYGNVTYYLYRDRLE